MKQLLFIIISAVFFIIPVLTHAVEPGLSNEYQNSLNILQENLNYLWVLLASAMVFLMQPGFMALESGIARAKNSINVAIKNTADFVIAVAGFWIIGFGLMFGDSLGGIMGSSYFLLDSSNDWLVIFFVFQAMFVGTAATIESGAMAERTKFGSYLMVSGLVSIIIYPVFGHWAWGGLFNEGQQGWLEKLGFIDFAGSTVVHSVGAWMSLAGIAFIGPRIGKFGADGKPNKIHPSNLTLAFLGTLLLFFGWFGFNCGSTLAADSSIALIAFNTTLSACFGCLSCTLVSWKLDNNNKLESEMVINGLLGGLVSITAGCASVTPLGAAIIGLAGGLLVYHSSKFIEHVLKLDDVVGAISVHGFCGAWGTIAVALFITDANLGEMGRLQLLGVQCLGVISCFIWTIGAGYLCLKLIDILFGLRVSVEEEMIGLNISEHGAKSTLVDLATSMHIATTRGKFTSDLAVEPEIGTEIGDLAIGFNSMLEAVSHALNENLKKQKIMQRQKKQIELNNSQTIEQNKRLEKEINQAAGIIETARENLAGLITSSVEAEDSVKKLGHSLKDINKVLQLLDELSREINLTSLNALIEAAHAGKHGDTFAVVANKVRSLSADSKSASEEISDIIDEIYGQMENTVTTIKKQSVLVENGREFMEDAQSLVQALANNGNNKPFQIESKSFGL
ncbi:ammonium transporter, Amt family [Candidatus Magnetomoraceae bacterium gMMP-15]